jgi:hypothetical protein
MNLNMAYRLALTWILATGACRAVSVEIVRVEITVRDKKSGQPVPCRMHLKDASGEDQRAGDLPFWFDHFVAPGRVQLALKPGRYTLAIERGPEFARIADTLKVNTSGEMRLEYSIERVADLASEGWWSGELHVHRPIEAIELLMRAEDLHVAPVITWWNEKNLWDNRDRPGSSLVHFDGDRFYHVMGGEDERQGGALLYFNLKKPLAISSPDREYPSPMKFVEEALRIDDHVWIDIEKPFWWDVPLWLATGKMKSIGLANNHMCRDRLYEDEAWGKPRPVDRLPAPLGNAYWTQEIYYHLLNAGLRMPPSAGSASGVLPNPVGYNRVYVHIAGELTYAKWWQGLSSGHSFVTNGPLLRASANGELPGHTFTAGAGATIELDLKAKLTTQDPIRFVEIIKNGRFERRVPFNEVIETGSLGAIRFDESGWFLLRAIAETKKTFRFASTAPFYVEIGKTKERISKGSAQFFLDWTRERMARVKPADATQREAVLGYHRLAEKFWRARVAKANAE